MNKAIIFDTETTGKNDPILIEAAWLRLESLNPFITSNSLNQRFNPNKKIELGALYALLNPSLSDKPLFFG
jgi:exodeoxyribonuclease X